MGQIYNYEPLWEQWHVENLYIKSMFGDVYRVFKKELDNKEYASVKIVSFPSPEQLSKAIFETRTSSESVLERYFENSLNEIKQEIELINSLKSTKGLIPFEEYTIKKRKHTTAWDILLRMKYFENLKNFLLSNKLEESDIVNMGLALINTIQIYNASGILHREINENNIFVTDSKEFMLGNFSISTNSFNEDYAVNGKGNILYTAPEVISGSCYDFAAEMYSIGILLYKLTNHDRMPFFPAYPNSIGIQDVDLAQQSRLKGISMPFPSNCSQSLGRIILKMCAFNKSDRYQKPYDLIIDLEKIKNNIPIQNSDDISKYKLIEAPKPMPKAIETQNETTAPQPKDNSESFDSYMNVKHESFGSIVRNSTNLDEKKSISSNDQSGLDYNDSYIRDDITNDPFAGNKINNGSGFKSYINNDVFPNNDHHSSDYSNNHNNRSKFSNSHDIYEQNHSSHNKNGYVNYLPSQKNSNSSIFSGLIDSINNILDNLTERGIMPPKGHRAPEISMIIIILSLIVIILVGLIIKNL